MEGTLLGGRYRLLEPLGRGGMGTVYEAVQEGLGRHVAVKLLDPRLAEDRQQLERFRREAEIVAGLGHPNIVQVTDFQYPDTPADQPFLVMEVLRGESLGARVAREQVLPGARVAFIIAQVLSALSAAHRAGVVHRDIKPDNIFLLADAAVPDTVKVLDFGIAKLAVEGQAKLTGTGAMLGTPAFMAPEQARGAEDVDARADIYAVGATMYQALSGKLPYDAPSIPALLFAIVEQTPIPLQDLRPDLPQGLVEIVERAMSKDRKERFPDAESMRRALSPWSGLPASVPPPVSVTAATLSDQMSAPLQATPIVVHRTPPPKTTPAAQSSPKRSLAMMWMVTLVIVVVIVTAGAVTVALRRDAPLEAAAHPTLVEPPATTSVPLAQSSAQAAGVAPSQTTAAALTTTMTPATTEHVVPPSPPRFGGKHASLSSTNFSDCKGCDWDGYREAIRSHEDAISACFKASEHEAPLHESVDYEVSVSASGAYTGFKTVSAATPPGLDRCMQKVLFAIPIQKASGGVGSFQIGFVSACTPGMANLPGSCK